MPSRFVSTDFAQPLSERRHNLFFALYPGPAAVPQILAVRKRLARSCRPGGRPTAANLLHVTLCGIGAFEGEVPLQLLTQVRTIAARRAGLMRSFRVQFNHATGFRTGNRRPPFVLCGDDGVVGIERLQQALHADLRTGGLCRGSGKSFNPHVTLVYGCDRVIDEQDIEPISWDATELVLVDSLVGQTRHMTLGRWPLNG